jgi:hypothetical protein
MKNLYFVAAGMLVTGAGMFGWRALRAGAHSRVTPAAGRPAIAQAGPPANSGSQATSPTASPAASAKRLGPFSIAGRDYIIDLQTMKVQPGPTASADTVVAMEIRDFAGTVQYEKIFPYVAGTDDDFESWSVSAQLLSGTNGKGILVSYDNYAEPSAPEEEPAGWLQVFGVLNGRLVPFGAPLEVQGGPLDQYVVGTAYKAARPLGAQSDIFEFKLWTGHCRLIYPLRVDWAQGKLSPAQECAATAAGLVVGCQYRVVPEPQLYAQGMTFVRLWPAPDEKSGQPVKTLVKKDSRVDLLTALVATQWSDGNATTSSSSKNPLEGAGGFAVAPDNDLWLQVRIDGREGWMHTEEDFRALGLPEDE